MSNSEAPPRAEANGETVAQAIKRLLRIALAIEDEQLTTPRPRGKRVFARIDTGVVDEGC
jgi:hypothetical protein